MAQHNELGKWGEDQAEKYLLSKGYIIRERNWRLGRRDIDILALTEDGLTLVFVEVKTRSYDDVMSPEMAVNKQKMRNIQICAHAYIKMFNWQGDARFDVISIVGTPRTDMNLEHIVDAFNPCLL